MPPLVYLACALILYSPFLAHPNRALPGGPDGVLYSWYFEWTDYALSHHHNPFVSGWLNAPQGINVLWNTGVFTLTLLFEPVTHFFGPLAACGLAMTLSPVASASACYFALRRITGVGWPMAVVATLYGFGPFFTGQNGHLHLIMAVFPPLVLYFGHRLFVLQTGSPVRTGCWFGLVVGLQLLTGEELVVLTAVCAVFAVLALVAVNVRQLSRARLSYASIGVGVGAGVSALIAAVPLWYQFFGPNALKGGVAAHEQRVGLVGLVTPSSLERFSTHSSRTLNATQMFANPVENTSYLGWPLLGLVALTCGYLLWRRERFLWWWLATAGLTLLVSMGSRIYWVGGRAPIGGDSLWSALRNVPLLQGVVVVRFTLLTTLLVAVLLGWGLARLPSGRWTALGTGLVILALIPLVPAERYRGFQTTRTPRFFTTRAVKQIAAGSVVLTLPVRADPATGALNMVWQMRAGLRYKLVGGWGVFDDHGTFTYHPRLPGFVTVLGAVGASGLPLSSAQRALGRRSVATSRVDYIVITAQQQHGAAVAAAAHEISGCRLEVVADVTLCAIGVSG